MLTVNDKKRLRHLYEKLQEQEEKEVIRYMLENNVKLEQEAIQMWYDIVT